MKRYIIDGNNLIGKISKLSSIQKKDKQASREQLAFLIENYFIHKKALVSLHFDGYMNSPVRITNGKVLYSESKTADEMIKQQIENAKNPKNLILISSDNNLREFARVCRCQVISSEEFGRNLSSGKKEDEEKSKIDEINNSDEFKKIFGVK